MTVETGMRNFDFDDNVVDVQQVQSRATVNTAPTDYLDVQDLQCSYDK